MENKWEGGLRREVGAVGGWIGGWGLGGLH